jgi:HAD superfamily hydrolase (TIGR01509 family)
MTESLAYAEEEAKGTLFGLIFDVDGVVGDTEAVNEIASVAALRELYGVTTRREDFREFVGTGSERYVEGVAEKYGLTIDLPRAVALRQAKILEALRRDGLTPYPGVLELMTAARAAGDFRLAIATSGPDGLAFPILAAAGVDRAWFDVIVTGSAVAKRKPDPMIYRLTGERLGLPPRACVVIEDAPAGVTAARTAGMHVIAVTNTVPAEALVGADRIVDSLASVSLDDLRALAHRRKRGHSSFPAAGGPKGASQN